MKELAEIARKFGLVTNETEPIALVMEALTRAYELGRQHEQEEQRKSDLCNGYNEGHWSV